MQQKRKSRCKSAYCQIKFAVLRTERFTTSSYVSSEKNRENGMPLKANSGRANDATAWDLKTKLQEMSETQINLAFRQWISKKSREIFLSSCFMRLFAKDERYWLRRHNETCFLRFITHLVVFLVTSARGILIFNLRDNFCYNILRKSNFSFKYACSAQTEWEVRNLSILFLILHSAYSYLVLFLTINSGPSITFCI